MRRAALLLLLCAVARAQVVQLVGGSSTLLAGNGGGATLYFPTSTIYTGFGCSSTGCAFGLADTFRFHELDITAGDRNFPASIDGGGLGVNVRGLSIERSIGENRLAGFVGATGPGFATSYFQTNTAKHAGMGLAFRRRAGAWVFQSLAVVNGNQKSLAASARYTSTRFGFVGAGGLMQGNPFVNGQVDFAAVKQHLTFSAARQQFYFPDAPSVTANSVGAYGTVNRFSFQATAIQGTAGGNSTRGFTTGAGVRLGPVFAQTSFFTTSKQRLLVTSLSESHRHWTATQTFGGNQFGIGGGYTSNRATLSITHSVMFFPLAGLGFQQVTAVQISLRLPHSDAVVNLGTQFQPTGHATYTAYGTNFIRGPLQGGLAMPQHRASSSGKYKVSGFVRDRAGRPVEGAAVALSGQTVFTDTTGAFFLRFRRVKAVSVVVRPEEFATPGRWVVVSAPDCVAPDSTPLAIVVTRFESE